MRIFFSFGYTYLFLSVGCEDLAECIVQVIVLEDHMHIFESGIILCHRSIMQLQLFHTLIRHVLLREHSGDLAATVCTEIEADGCISVL